MAKQQSTRFLSSIIKGGFTALITTLIAVLIFAWIIKSATLDTSVIKAVHQFIKVISVFLGCLFCVREEKGLIKGLLVGVLSFILTALTYSLVFGNGFNGLNSLIDLGFLAVVGAICGVITVNLKQK